MHPDIDTDGHEQLGKLVPVAKLVGLAKLVALSKPVELSGTDDTQPFGVLWAAVEGRLLQPPACRQLVDTAR